MTVKTTPTPPQPQQQQQQQQQLQRPETLTEAQMTNKAVKPNIKLPQPWMIFWSNSNKRWYFNDTAKNKSIWAWPPA